MKVFERLVTLMIGLFLPLFAFADGPGRMGEGMMGGNMMMGSNSSMMTGMGQHTSMHDMMMGGISDPIMKQNVIDEMDRHHLLMKDLLEHAIDDPELKQQLLEKIENCSLSPKLFTHKTMLRLSWILIKKYGMDEAVEKTIEIIKKAGFEAIDAGQVENGEKKVIIEPKNLVYGAESLDLR